MALTPRCLISSTAAFDLASLRPTITISAPASASPRAMPRPMPPLPPVTMATLPLRSNGDVCIVAVPLFVRRGLVPGIRVLLSQEFKREDVDGRDEARP